MIMKAFIESQFNYCPLIWVFRWTTLISKIIRLHEKALRIGFSDYYKSSFCELLEKDKSFSIHHQNIPSLAIEIYKYLHNFSPCIMNNIFKVNQTVPYDLRKWNFLQNRIPFLLDMVQRPYLSQLRKYGHFFPKQWKTVIV